MSTLALHAGTERPYKGPFLRRLKEGFQDKESRQYFGVYLVGKMIGLIEISFFISFCVSQMKKMNMFTKPLQHFRKIIIRSCTK